MVIATGVTADGHREVLGCNMSDAETLAFWKECLGSLRNRGLHGVQLAISDQQRGRVSAIERTMTGAGWQRCRVHFTRNVLAKVAQGQSGAVAAMARTLFVQHFPAQVGEQGPVVADTLRAQFPAVADVLDGAGRRRHRVCGVPRGALEEVWSTNPWSG